MRLLALIILLSSCQTRYGAPKVEDCILLAKHTVDKDAFRCFCIDKSLNKNNYNNLYDRVKKQMSDHPMASKMLSYIIDNKKDILKKHEYTLNGYYCRGYSAVSPRNREKLSNWAEENRVKRIKCEKRR